MKRFAPLLLLAALALPGLASATTEVSLTDAAQAQIRTILQADGFEVRSIQTEDGMYEAYATRDGERFEIYLDGDFAIVRTVQD